jgi:hypothetical protein
VIEIFEYTFQGGKNLQFFINKYINENFFWILLNSFKNQKYFASVLKSFKKL